MSGKDLVCRDDGKESGKSELEDGGAQQCKNLVQNEIDGVKREGREEVSSFSLVLNLRIRRIL